VAVKRISEYQRLKSNTVVPEPISMGVKIVMVRTGSPALPGFMVTLPLTGFLPHPGRSIF
jgi:hypothetical protein